MANNEKEKYKSRFDQFKSGAICLSYGSTNFVSVNPAPDIDKCRFSVVKIGTDGKDALDFYLDVQDMRQLCEEFLGDATVAKRKLNADMSNQYPSAYRYVTGQNGSLELNIGAGDKGCRVQIRDKSQNNQKMSVVPFKNLREMAFGFYLVMGLIPVMKNSYYGKLYQAFWEGVEERNKLFTNKDNNSANGSNNTPAAPLNNGIDRSNPQNNSGYQQNRQNDYQQRRSQNNNSQGFQNNTPQNNQMRSQQTSNRNRYQQGTGQVRSQQGNNHNRHQQNIQTRSQQTPYNGYR